MFKTRTLPFVWGGSYPPKWFYGGVGPSREDQIRQACGGAFEEYLKERYAFGKSNASSNFTFSGTQYVGEQHFASTTRKRPAFNDCVNGKSWGQILNFAFAGLQQTTPWNPDYNNYWFPMYYAYKPTVNYVLDPITSHFEVDWGDAQRNAWHEMQPRFEGDVDMFNFIIELKDFKSLAKRFTGLLESSTMDKLRNTIRRGVPRIEASRPVCDLFLQWNLAVKPFLSDLGKILNQVEDTVANAQQAYADAGLGRNSRHWSETRTVLDELVYGGAYYYYRAMGQLSTQKFTATMEYSYGYSAREPLDAFKRYWGLNPTAEGLWNAIPFSFLADYVSTIGRSIAAMEKDPNTHVRLSQYCESLLSVRSNGYHVLPSNCYGGIAIVDGNVTRSKTLCSGLQSSLFTRRLTEPNKGTSLPRLKKPTTKQGLIAAALLRSHL